MKPQYIETDGKTAFAVIPVEEYERLRNAAEMLEDVTTARDAQAALARGEELVPNGLVERLLAGDNAIKVWREHREMNQQALADCVGVTKGYISQLESGQREGSIDVLIRIAGALTVMVDDLVVWHGQ